jgi:hypothetical protein
MLFQVLASGGKYLDRAGEALAGITENQADDRGGSCSVVISIVATRY